MAFLLLFCHKYNAFLAAQRFGAQALDQTVPATILLGMIKTDFN